MHGVMGSNPGHFNVFPFMQLLYCHLTLYKELLDQHFIFSEKSIPMHLCIALLHVALVSISPQVSSPVMLVLLIVGTWKSIF
jgi:hypothetical protein